MFAVPPPTGYDLRWRMLGVPVRVHPSFWLVCLLTGLTASGGATGLIIWTLALLLSLLTHELGHALVARHYGSRRMEIVLYALGGVAVNADAPRFWPRVRVLAAGIAFGLLLGGASLFVQTRFGALWPYNARLLLDYLIMINLFLALFNAVPVYPLDGGQIAYEFFARNPRGDGALKAHKLSMVVAGVVAVAGLVFLGSFFIAILFGFLAAQNWMMIKQYRARW